LSRDFFVFLLILSPVFGVDSIVVAAAADYYRLGGLASVPAYVVINKFIES
jgi:hypothetical protein